MCQIQALSATYTTVHRNARSFTHWVRPGIDPTSSWILVGFISTELWWELLPFFFFFNGCTFGIGKFPGQVSNPSHSCGNTGSFKPLARPGIESTPLQHPSHCSQILNPLHHSRISQLLFKIPAVSTSLKPGPITSLPRSGRDGVIKWIWFSPTEEQTGQHVSKVPDFSAGVPGAGRRRWNNQMQGHVHQVHKI